MEAAAAGRIGGVGQASFEDGFIISPVTARNATMAAAARAALAAAQPISVGAALGALAYYGALALVGLAVLVSALRYYADNGYRIRLLQKRRAARHRMHGHPELGSGPGPARAEGVSCGRQRGPRRCIRAPQVLCPALGVAYGGVGRACARPDAGDSLALYAPRSRVHCTVPLSCPPPGGGLDSGRLAEPVVRRTCA